MQSLDAFLGIILGMALANERRRYIVTLLSLAEPIPRMMPGSGNSAGIDRF